MVVKGKTPGADFVNGQVETAMLVHGKIQIDCVGNRTTEQNIRGELSEPASKIGYQIKSALARKSQRPNRSQF